jgi:hypothetical protein
VQQSFDLPSLFTQDGFFFARKLDLARVSRTRFTGRRINAYYGSGAPYGASHRI